jgi:hypothetical protein
MPRTVTVTTTTTKTLGQILYETMRKRAPRDPVKQMMPVWEALDASTQEEWEGAAEEFASVVEANAVDHPLVDDETARRAFEPTDPAPSPAQTVVDPVPVDRKRHPRIATSGIAGGRFYADVLFQYAGQWRVGDELVIDGHRVRVNRISPPFAYAEEILPENPS